VDVHCLYFYTAVQCWTCELRRPGFRYLELDIWRWQKCVFNDRRTVQNNMMPKLWNWWTLTQNFDILYQVHFGVLLDNEYSFFYLFRESSIWNDLNAILNKISCFIINKFFKYIVYSCRLKLFVSMVHWGYQVYFGCVLVRRLGLVGLEISVHPWQIG